MVHLKLNFAQFDVLNVKIGPGEAKLWVFLHFGFHEYLENEASECHKLLPEV